MRVFLDSNVIISAFATRGLCSDLFTLVLSEHQLVTSDLVIKEVRSAFAKKFKVPAETIREIEAVLRTGLVRSGARRLELPGLDQSDAIIAATAMDAQCDVFVTGDLELLSASGDALKVKVLNPRGFWELLRSQSSPK